MSNEEVNVFKNCSTSSNLIDFNSPISSTNVKKNYLIPPLIPAPIEQRLLLAPLDSINNNPFDAVLQQTTHNEIVKNDPFELVFEKAFHSNDNECINDISSGILNSPHFESFNDNKNISIHTPENRIVTPTISLTTPSSFQCLSNSTEKEWKNCIARRVSRCFDEASPCSSKPELQLDYVNNLKRSVSNSALDFNRSTGQLVLTSQMSTDEMLHNLRNYRKSINASTSIFDREFIASDTKKFETETSPLFTLNSLNNAFYENELLHSSSSGLFSHRRSFSARKPTKIELLALQRSNIFNTTNKISNFQNRLNIVSNHDKYEEKENLDDSIFFEAKQMAQTFQKFADVSNNGTEISDLPSEEELLSLNPNWICIDDVDISTSAEIHKELDESNVFQKNDNIFPSKNCDNKTSLDENDTKCTVSSTSDIEKKLTRQTSNKQLHTIELLENLAQLLKNDNKKKKENLQEKLINSLVHVLDDNESDATASLDNSAELDEQSMNIELSQMKRCKSLNNGISNVDVLRKSFSNRRTHSVIDKVTKNIDDDKKSNNIIQKIGEKLRLKRGNDSNKQNAIKSNGPMKALIPINNMTRDNKSSSSIKSMSSTNYKSRVFASTPKTDAQNCLKSKPVAQSTPTIQISKRKNSFSGCSPNNESTSSLKKPNNSKESARSGQFKDKNGSSVTFSDSLSELSDSVFEKSKLKRTNSVSSTSSIKSNCPSNNRSTGGGSMVRRKSASEIKSNLIKKIPSPISYKNNANTNQHKSITNTLRPLNSVLKTHRSSSIPNGKENYIPI